MTKQELVVELEKLNLDSSKVDKLEEYMLATLKANESFNLTAIKDEKKFRELMILDSAYPLNYFDFTKLINGVTSELVYDDIVWDKPVQKVTVAAGSSAAFFETIFNSSSFTGHKYAVAKLVLKSEHINNSPLISYAYDFGFYNFHITEVNKWTVFTFLYTIPDTPSSYSTVLRVVNEDSNNSIAVKFALSQAAVCDSIEDALYFVNNNIILKPKKLIQGPTANRPTQWLSAGDKYFDEGLGKPIWWNGSTWVDATGTPV